ncbi:ornithine-acyl-ACP acyltransferase [Jannaschia pagri]|uniref:L-ornithine N(alpha)-acyltransferase n=1 Tax=Jannaschia pagri TaxID=2829797 RepID=A0ABQ4NPA3_9RHOB|nr:MULTISPECIES: GNAT family N-acetyltransferase [unclassified Jannaschia]GIT92225.1 ornithine-acyl-ACP acyltransferase [Jannaschia sp. AI_61]GIT96059.1 ornithine-acyl-ACP acyltransferase [Jannaschia sp. AI_62]
MTSRFDLTITQDPDAVRAAQGLRHAVFVEERGQSRPNARPLTEADAFDTDADHVILRDKQAPKLGVIATARLGRGCQYTAQEFDVSALQATGRPIVELGRTCLHPAYRGGLAAVTLFTGILDHLAGQDLGYLIGTASFDGADPSRHLPALRALRATALAPEDLRPVARGPDAVSLDGPVDRLHMRDVPSLIKSYLRAGAWVGEGAWVDHAFDTVDVCIVLDMARLRLPRAAQLARAGACVAQTTRAEG